MRYGIAIGLAALIACGPALADNDHDRARRALQRWRPQPGSHPGVVGGRVAASNSS